MRFTRDGPTIEGPTVNGEVPPFPGETDPAPATGPHTDPTLSREELKERASAGIFIVASRGLTILLIGFGGNVVLAHLLTPHDFGIVAVGTSLVLFASALADGGLGAALIRRPEPPATEELQALTGLQLVITIALALGTAAVGALYGRAGLIAAVMVSSMPFAVMQFPGRILFERSLSYRSLAVVEVVQVVTSYAWAVGLVAAGFGVWGLATSEIAMRVIGWLVMVRLSPAGFVRPRLSWKRIRPLMGFGLRFQATSAAWLVRDQGLNASIAAIANVSTLGLWSLARRVMEVPYLLFHTLWRVSYPAMSKVLAAKEDVAPLIERATSMAAIGSGLILAALAGSALRLIPGVFGQEWRQAASVMPAACLGLAISGSISVATQGFLYAVGDVSAVLRSSIYQAIVWFAVSLPLLPVIGVSAIGVGWLASSLVEAAVLARATRRWTTTRLVRPLAIPVMAGIVSAGAGFVVSRRGGNDLVSGLLGGISAGVAFLVILALVHRSMLLRTYRFILSSMRAAMSGGAPGT
jgi:O-antigen/teichoic acid export membrane protein